MIILQLDVRCRRCGNEDEASVPLPDDSLNMVPVGTLLKAQSHIRECDLCRQPLTTAK